MQILRRIIKTWLPLALVSAFLSAFFYTTVQQNFRMNANDPQIQMAEDAAQALAGGQAMDSLLPGGKVDIATSLAPYLIYYDAQGKPSAGSGMLHGSLPDFPAGAFVYAREKNEDRVSWQPETGVRSATVLVAVKGGSGGFFLAGRSLREVEARIDNLGMMTAAGCIGTMAAALVLVGLLELLPITRAS